MRMDYLFKINTYKIFRIVPYKVESLSWKLHLCFFPPLKPDQEEDLKAFFFLLPQRSPIALSWGEATSILQYRSLCDLMKPSNRRELLKLLFIQHFF